MKSRPTLRFYLKPHKNKVVNTVMGRVTFVKKKAEFATEIQTISKDIDKLKGNEQSKLEVLQQKFNNYIIVLEHQGATYDSKTIRDYLDNRKVKTTGLKTFLIEYGERLDSNGLSLAKSSILLYKQTIKYFTSFLKAQPVEFDKLRSVVIVEFDLWLKSQRSSNSSGSFLSSNTVSKHHSRLRTILNKALELELLSENPYSKLNVIKFNDPPLKYLTQEQLTEIHRVEVNTNAGKMELAKDYFLFEVYTGIRYGDIFSLKTSHLLKENGEYYLLGIQGKTKSSLRVPLVESAIKIIQKYSEHIEREIDKSILPAISNQKLNENLKKIQSKTTISIPLTSHVARHTCATFLLSCGHDIYFVKEWLGHQSIKTTMKYAKFTQKFLGEAVKKIDERFKSLEH